MQGKIIKGIAGFYYVNVVESGLYECKAKGSFRKNGIKPLVGDEVELEVLDEEEKIGNVTKILPRKNELIRPAVANIDQALVVFAVTEPKPHYNLLDRFLVMMERKEIPVILCFNKTDLAEHPEIAELEEVYASCGYPVLFTSAKKEENIEKLKQMLKGKTTSIAGPVRSRKVLSDQSAPVRRTDGNRKYQQKNCKRKAYHEAFRTDHDQSGFLYYGYTGIQFPLCE